MPQYKFVDEPNTLVTELQCQGQIGIDTEFMRERTYFAQLCLTQIATENETWCVDPLAGHAQDAFWNEILTHDWVLHSARQDIEVIYQTAGSMPSDRTRRSSHSSRVKRLRPSTNSSRLRT